MMQGIFLCANFSKFFAKIGRVVIATVEHILLGMTQLSDFKEEFFFVYMKVIKLCRIVKLSRFIVCMLKDID